jgi:dihydrofolate reductase
MEAPMRKVTYGGAVSLDGFIAGPGESIDWIRQSPETAELMKAMWSSVDTMLMGRKTYEFAVRMGGPIQWGDVRTYVFSSTLSEVSGGATLFSGDAAGFVRELKAREGGDIVVMGGGELGSALVEAGLIDEVGFTIQPVLLGGGTPAFQPLRSRVALELIEERAMGKGCVLVRYRVAN